MSQTYSITEFEHNSKTFYTVALIDKDDSETNSMDIEFDNEDAMNQFCDLLDVAGFVEISDDDEVELARIERSIN